MPEFTLGEIARRIGGELVGDPAIRIENAAEIEKAGERHITFLANPRYKSHLERTGAAAVIIDARAGVQPSIPYIKTADAYYGFLQTFLLFHPAEKALEAGIHPTAVVESSARIAPDAAIGANVYIGEQVTVGSGTQILPNCVILRGVSIGEQCLLYPLVSVREGCRIGNRVIVHNGAVIGSDGFGFAPHGGKFHKIPQVGIVVIEDDVEIGANTTIDRATMGETVIRSGVKLDNLIQIAHNVVIGSDTVMAAQTGVSGSAKVGRQVMMGGQVGIAGHLTVGDRVQIAAQSGIARSVADDSALLGSPARPIMLAKRVEAALNSLPELLRRVRRLEKELESSQKK